jgi:hypothetical protein
VGIGLAVGIGVSVAGTVLTVVGVGPGVGVGVGVAWLEQAATASSKASIEPVRVRCPVFTLSSSVTLVFHRSPERSQAQGSRLAVIRA